MRWMTLQSLIPLTQHDFWSADGCFPYNTCHLNPERTCPWKHFHLNLDHHQQATQSVTCSPRPEESVTESKTEERAFIAEPFWEEPECMCTKSSSLGLSEVLRGDDFPTALPRPSLGVKAAKADDNANIAVALWGDPPLALTGFLCFLVLCVKSTTEMKFRPLSNNWKTLAFCFWTVWWDQKSAQGSVIDHWKLVLRMWKCPSWLEITGEHNYLHSWHTLNQIRLPFFAN